MEFCIISPTAGLERYARLSKTHLVLQTVDDPDYREFYGKECRRLGDTIILDNGSYEGAHLPSPAAYMDDIRFFRPRVTVLPDYLLQPWKKTWHAACHYLDILEPWLQSHDITTEWCYIPQAEKGDLHGFLESYTEAASDPRITWLGIPRALAYAITDNPLARVEFARMVRKDHPRLKLHAFGMVNGDIHELPYLAAAGVTSIDSSAPVWRGWDQVDIRIYIKDGFPPVNFSAEWDPLTDCIIKSNLEACGVRTSNRE